MVKAKKQKIAGSGPNQISPSIPATRMKHMKDEGTVCQEGKGQGCDDAEPLAFNQLLPMKFFVAFTQNEAQSLVYMQRLYATS